MVDQKIAQFKILEKLGEGGMGTVYKALDTRLDRIVAIKVIRRERVRPDLWNAFLKHFDQEARALAKLSHPNIVPLLDYGQQDGEPYLVMSFVPGGSLQQMLDAPGKPMPWQQAARLLQPVAEALDYIHQQGLVHRDVKPSNILLTADGKPLLSDFGLDKALEQRDGSEFSLSAMAPGTATYAAPEQARGHAVDRRADVYSLGVIVYQMVTGRLPFKGDNAVDVLLQQVSAQPPRPGSLVSGLPQSVETAIMKSLEKEPEKRYSSAGAFIKAMEQAVPGRATVAHSANRRLYLWGVICGLAVISLAAWALRTKPLIPTLATGTPTATVTSTTPAASQTPTKTASKTTSPTRMVTPTIPAATFTPVAISDVIGRVTASFAYVRYGPGSNFRAIVSVSEGDELKIVGRSEEGEWLVVELADGQLGWILDQYMDGTSFTTVLAVIRPPPTPTPDYSPTPIPGLIKIYPKADINRDCVVDERDVQFVIDHFTGFDLGDPNYDSRADFNGDGRVSSYDYNYVVSNMGATCEYKPKK